MSDSPGSVNSKYYAFISYSRKDSKAAAWLQQRLEWFRFPVKLVPAERRPPNARYVRPIYRDKTNLEVTDEHYWTNIRRALEESRYLIVLCSPHAAASEPVNMEVAHFLATHGGDASLVAPVIVSGNVTSVGTDAALCPALRALGDALTSRNLPTMVPDAVTAEQDAWEHGFVSLVSYLLRLERTALGDHIQRETRRQTRVLRRWLVAVGMLTAIAGVSAWLALKAKREVEKTNTVMTANLHEASMVDYHVALQRMDEAGTWHEGLVYLARSLKWWPENPLAAARLYSTLSLHGVSRQTWPRLILPHEYDANELRHREIEPHDDSPGGEYNVQNARFSSDGKRILTQTVMGGVRIWDAATGQRLSEPLRDERGRVEISPDGSHLLVQTSNKSARVLDANMGQVVSEFARAEGFLRSAEFSPDGKRIVTASDLAAQVWDASTGKPIGEPLPHEEEVFSARFSPDGMRIVTTSGKLVESGIKTALVWDLATGRPLGGAMQHTASLTSAQFSPDSARVLTLSYDTAWIWDAATGQPVGQPLRHKGVGSAHFSPDGTRLLTVGGNFADQTNEARIWDALTGRPIGSPIPEVTSAGFSPNGLHMWLVVKEDIAVLFETVSQKPLGYTRYRTGLRGFQFSPDGTRFLSLSGHMALVFDAPAVQPPGEPLRSGDPVLEAQFSRDGTRILARSKGKAARLWDVSTGTPLGEPLQHEAEVGSAEFSRDDTRIVTAAGMIAQVWDATTGARTGAPLRHQETVWSAHFSPDGTRILTTSGRTLAQVWDAATRKTIGEPLRHGETVLDAQFSPDGTRIVTASYDNTARVWDAATGKPRGEPIRHKTLVGWARFNPTGTRIVTLTDNVGWIWDAASGKSLGEPLLHKDRAVCAHFSPDGTRILTAASDGGQLWEAATGKPLGEPLPHPKAQSAQFSPDGSQIVTAGGDGTVKVWDAATGLQLGEPLLHQAWVTSAQFSPDGRRIVTASDSTRVWEAAGLRNPPTPVPEWMLDRTRAVAGMEFDNRGALQPIPQEVRRNTILQAAPANQEWSKLARWLAQPANERTLTPDSKFTCRQIAERERDSGFKEGIESALRYDPTVPLAHVLLAKFEDNPQRADFLRGYGLKLLPDDATLWTRAAASLVEQKDFARALKAADKALALEPKNADALQARAAAVEGK